MKTLKAMAVACTALVPTASLADWSGLYLGGGLSNVTSGELSATLATDSTGLDVEQHGAVGLFVGYQVQNGDFVFGGEYAISAAPNVSFEDDPEEFAFAYGDLKLKAGYAFDQLMGYGVVGIATIAFDSGDGIEYAGSGIGFGIGADYAVSDSFIVGAELFSRSTTGDLDVGVASGERDLDATSISFRGSFKF
ncbi:porin family protein [Yoonia sp. F2084L]|uniref:outer membrane protein n=1 Tax=Yoonia sp. F2084L TaxID=2926419 RepID=UPI001FF17BD3|nr:outer membrane beta-barrel protein [Yoonia sp. F2084L]MCK0095286.1 porin family protein [Yoonia sp. F2084L]